MRRSRKAHRPALDAVLFDLDDTLCPTGHLDSLRRNRQEEELQRALPILQSCQGIDRAIGVLVSRLPVGIVSRAPRWYVKTLLEHLFPTVQWSAVVCHGDAMREKPYPDPLHVARDRLGITDTSRVAYIGDDRDDIEAAYHARMRPVLATWANQHKVAPSLVPDAILTSPEELIPYVQDPDSHLPALECVIANRPVESARHRSLAFKWDREDVTVEILGRYFPRVGDTLALHEAHSLSQHIDKKERDIPFPWPDSWVKGVSWAVADLATERGVEMVTVIPAKTGRDPRLERLLDLMSRQLTADGLTGLDFSPNLLAFSDDAQTIKHGGQSERRKAVEQTLRLRSECCGKHVLVIDDVLTTGATLHTARHLLIGGAARQVTLLALSKTISEKVHFTRTPEVRLCPQCGQILKQLQSRSGHPFRGCTGWIPDGSGCNYTENIN